MKKFITVVILCLCLVQVDRVTVPSRDTVHKDLKFVKYNSAKHEFVDYGMANETWCRQNTTFAASICSRPDFIPAEDKLLFSIREDLFKEENLHYLTAGTIYFEQVRRPSRRTNEQGKTCYVFDCDTLPFTPPKMEIQMHSGGSFEWNKQHVRLQTPQSTEGNELIRGYDFLRELADRNTLNGTALEYLVSSPFLFPKEWYGRQILFPGTIYVDKAQRHYASLLFHNGKRLMASLHPLDYEVYASSIAAIVIV